MGTAEITEKRSDPTVIVLTWAFMMLPASVKDRSAPMPRPPPSSPAAASAAAEVLLHLTKLCSEPL